MQNLSSSFSIAEHYDDGIQIDYSMLIRLWSAFDRSLTTFNQRCGVITHRDKNRRPDGRKTESTDRS
jgi:hypothetical protein